MNGYITVQEAAKKWSVTPRQVQILCKENKVVGAMRMSRIWIIPEDAQKPTNSKRTSNRTGGKRLLQRTLYKKQNIDLSSAPWTMHEFFAGSGLVAYGLKGMFAPIWVTILANRKRLCMKPILDANILNLTI